MFLVHRVLHPATAAHAACWSRVSSDHDELVLTVGRELHVYAIVNGSLALRRVWRFEARIEAAAPAKRPSLKRDALVIAFAPARLAIIDDCEGEPRTLVRYDLEAQVPNDPFQLNPLKANKGGPCSWPVVLDASPSIAVVRAQARVVAVPLIHCASRTTNGEPPPPFFIDGALSEDVVVRLLAFAPSGPPTVILCCADARGDQPASTSIIALGLDAARRSSYQRWRVDALAAAPRGLIPLRKGGCVVLFRHTLTKVSSGGAIDAVALNGFAGEDFGPSDCRAVPTRRLHFASTRSERPRNRTRDHPLHCEMDTSRVDGVKRHMTRAGRAPERAQARHRRDGRLLRLRGRRRSLLSVLAGRGVALGR